MGCQTIDSAERSRRAKAVRRSLQRSRSRLALQRSFRYRPHRHTWQAAVLLIVALPGLFIGGMAIG